MRFGHCDIVIQHNIVLKSKGSHSNKESDNLYKLKSTAAGAIMRHLYAHRRLSMILFLNARLSVSISQSLQTW